MYSSERMVVLSPVFCLWIHICDARDVGSGVEGGFSFMALMLMLTMFFINYHQALFPYISYISSKKKLVLLLPMHMLSVICFPPVDCVTTVEIPHTELVIYICAVVMKLYP